MEVLGLFNNEILNERKALDVLETLTNLKELNIDGNPVSSNVRFKYELTLRLKKLEILDDESIKDLDREIAEQFFIQNKSKLSLNLSHSTLTRHKQYEEIGIDRVGIEE